MKPKIYIETTIISYLTALPSRDLITAAHQQITKEWWKNRRVSFDLFISELVLAEANAGDASAIQRRFHAMEEFPLLRTHDAAMKFAEKLIEDGALPPKATGDALHLAIATTNGMEYLLTWNLKHLANAVMRNRISESCREHGFEPPIICTPEELLEE